MLFQDLYICQDLHLTKVVKASSTFSPVRAEVYRQRHFFQLTKVQMFYILTYRSLTRSDLLPTSKMTALDSPQASSSLSQLFKFQKDLWLVRSKAMMMPRAFLQQAEVMALKRSCPAVSQICVLMIILLTMKVLMASSTPMVGLESSLKTFQVYLVRILVFPTPESPTMMILNMKSGSMLLAMFDYF